MTTLDAISDLRRLADDVRDSMPDLAERLGDDIQAILADIAPVPVSRIAAVLAVSRPTVYGLIEDGHLGAVSVAGHKAVDPTSVIDILPVVREWQANGAVGGLRRHLRNWLAAEEVANPDRQRYRALIKSGYDPEEWPDERSVNGVPAAT